MDLTELEDFIQCHDLKVYEGPVPEKDFSKTNPSLHITSIVTKNENKLNYRWGCVLGIERVDPRTYNILFLGRLETLEDGQEFLEKELEKIPYDKIDVFHRLEDNIF